MQNYIDEHHSKDEASIKFKRAPRIRGKRSPRPILMKSSINTERENVLKAYCEKRKKNTVNQAPDNPTNEEDVWKTITANGEFPERVIRERFKLHPFLKSSI